MQSGEGAQQPLPHVGAHSGRRLASADQLRTVEIDGNELRKRAAEVDEKSEARHCGARLAINLTTKATKITKLVIKSTLKPSCPSCSSW